MQQDIRPAPNRKLRGELPGLKPGVVLKVVKWFEEIEDYASVNLS